MIKKEMEVSSLVALSGVYSRHMKRALDLAISIPLSVIAVPLALAIAAAIKAEDRGPVFFRQRRVGRNGVEFTITKFRSMPCGTPHLESAIAGELEVTRVGRLIRRVSLDEIPQVLSVIAGDMSLVGPRPPIPQQVPLIQMRKENGSLSLKPGLTGLAQVEGYDGMSESVKSGWDAVYLNRLSLAMDLRILVRTVAYIFRKPPSY